MPSSEWPDSEFGTLNFWPFWLSYVEVKGLLNISPKGSEKGRWNGGVMNVAAADVAFDDTNLRGQKKQNFEEIFWSMAYANGF